MDRAQETELGASGAEFDFKLYRFVPALPAAIISVIVSVVLTITQLMRQRETEQHLGLTKLHGRK
jgi:hypothetical protein